MDPSTYVLVTNVVALIGGVIAVVRQAQGVTERLSKLEGKVDILCNFIKK